jgi:hypothetical protein
MKKMAKKKAPAKRRTRAERLKDDGVLKGRLAKHDHEAIESLTAAEHKQLTKLLKKVKKAYPPGKKMNANFV